MDKTLNKMNKELGKLNKNINNLTEQKDEVTLDIKNKTEYKKKLEQSVNSLKMIETSDTKKMIENIQKEVIKIEVAIEDLKDKKDSLVKDLKAATDVYKRLESHKATYTEFVESLNKTEDDFFNVLDSYNEANKKKKDKKEDRNEQDLDEEKNIR